MMLPPGRQIYLQPSVTLNFGLLTPKVDHFIPLLHGARVPICIKIGSFVFSTVFKSLVWYQNERTNERTG